MKVKPPVSTRSVGFPLRLPLVRLLRRPIAALLALWMALYLGAPQLVHPCPAHSALRASHAASASSAARHGGHHQAAPSGARGESGAHDLVSAPGDHGEHHRGDRAGDSCCCPGPQCGSGSALLEGALAWHFAGVIRATDARAFGPRTPGRPRAAHSLPFATAPPAALIA